MIRKQIRRLIEPLRRNMYVSNAATLILRPVQRTLAACEKQIRTAVYANGRTVDYDGVSISFPPGVGIEYCSDLFWNTTDCYELPVWRSIKKLSSNAKTFLDIGSNIGLFSVALKKLRPDIECIAFEPIPPLHAQNRLFHVSNNLPEHNILQLAMSNDDGDATIFLPKSHSGWGIESTASLETDSWQARKSSRTFTVKTVRLDTFASSCALNGPLLLKIDVEGHEDAVFAGGVKVIAELRPAIICEVLPRLQKSSRAGDFLSPLGYSPFAILPQGMFRVEWSDLLTTFPIRDFAFLHEDRVGRGVNFLPI